MLSLFDLIILNIMKSNIGSKVFENESTVELSALIYMCIYFYGKYYKGVFTKEHQQKILSMLNKNIQTIFVSGKSFNSIVKKKQREISISFWNIYDVFDEQYSYLEKFNLYTEDAQNYIFVSGQVITFAFYNYMSIYEKIPFKSFICSDQIKTEKEKEKQKEKLELLKSFFDEKTNQLNDNTKNNFNEFLEWAQIENTFNEEKQKQLFKDINAEI